MLIFEEVQKVIAQLPPEQAKSLRLWLKEFQAARRYKQIKAYTMANQTLADFEKTSGNALWN